MRQISLGTDDFRKIREGQFLYVDKSLFIREVLKSGEVLLLPRPRRFGKTLNMTMLQSFFDVNQDSRALFEGLAISRDPVAMAQLNSHPTLFLTFKDLKALDWDECRKGIVECVGELIDRHYAGLDLSKISPARRARFQAAYDQKAPVEDLKSSLNTLTELLYLSTGKKVVLLIDEYDTPIHSGQAQDYYPQVIHFMRGFLGMALKGNRYLERAVITGILRVGKESIFSGLNNLQVSSVLEHPFSTYFGFTEEEVAQLLIETDSPHPLSEVQSWYNGYRFGETTIYNPWSILQMLQMRNARLKAYWIGTSENDLIKTLVKERQAIQLTDLEVLLRGESLPCEIQESVAMADLNEVSVWSLLLFSGYLTVSSWEPETMMAQLRLPNREVRGFFQRTVIAWLGSPTHVDRLKKSLLAVRLDQFARHLAESLKTILSYHDVGPKTEEKTYHVLMVGLLASLDDHYTVLSNRESGHGRYDLALKPRKKGQPGFVFEFKQTNGKNLLQKAHEARDQAREKDYVHSMHQDGVSPIVSIGLAFREKWVALSGLIQKGDTQEFVQFDPEGPANPPDTDPADSPKCGLPSKPENDLNPAQGTRGKRTKPAPSGAQTHATTPALVAMGPATDPFSSVDTEPNSLPERGDLPAFSRIEHRPNPVFTGRHQDLLDLHRSLNTTDKAVITPLAASTGMGGIGKTQLAIEYAYRYGRFYPGGVFWLDFGDPEQVPSELISCGVKMGLFAPDDPRPQDAKLELVHQSWAQGSAKRLLIFDDCECEDLLDTWAPRSGPNHVLVTSRNQHWSPVLGLKQCRLSLLARAESIALLRGLCPPLTEEQADAIAAELGDLPLALHLAGSYLAYYKEDPRRYLAELTKQPLQHPSLTSSKQRYQPTKHDDHVGRTFARSFARLNPQDPTDQLARTLLLHAAQFAPGEPIHEQHLLATVEADPRASKDALVRLLERGLIQQQDQTLTLHRLLPFFCQDSFPAEEQNQARSHVATVIASLQSQ